MSKSNQSALPHQLSAQDSHIRRPLRIALFGFGTVGSSVARILVESRPEGLELTHIYVRSVARRRVDWVPASVVWSENAGAVLASDVDVIVELAGGLDPAGGWVRKALRAGKSVVTANKKLISCHGAELERLAAAASGQLKYDNFNGRWGDPAQLDRFLQAYAVERARAEARRRGHAVTEAQLPDGSIKLTIQVQGGAA